MKKIIGLFVLGSLVMSCSHSDDLGDDPIPIRLGSKIQVETKALPQIDQIVAGQELSLFVTSASQPDSILQRNVQMSTDENGNFDMIPTVYYPLGRNIDLYAVHPYLPNAQFTTNTPVEFTVHSDQTTLAGFLNSDLLYASKMNVERTKDQVTLYFCHLLSRLTFVVKQGDATSLANLDSIRIMDVYDMVYINLTDGNLTGGNGSTADIAVYGVRGGSESSVNEMAAIIVPQEFVADYNNQKAFLTVKVGEQIYSYIPTDNIVFEGGKSYDYTITVYSEGLQVSREITDWNPTP